jgi:mannosyltransferase OCH1-like enzyme
MSSIQKCVVESVAQKNENDEIIVYSNSFMDVNELEFANIQRKNYSVTDIFRGLPFQEWHAASVGVIDLADALRLAILYKFGGVYLDMDLVRCSPPECLVCTWLIV